QRLPGFQIPGDQRTILAGTVSALAVLRKRDCGDWSGVPVSGKVRGKVRVFPKLDRLQFARSSGEHLAVTTETQVVVVADCKWNGTYELAIGDFAHFQLERHPVLG